MTPRAPGLTRAMVLTAPGRPLALEERSVPRPRPGEILLRVHACGVCRTDLHIVDGELTEPALPLVPGHEIVGAVVECGAGVTRFKTGDRVGVPWLGSTCGACPYCAGGRENLCDAPMFTGYTRDGGYAEHAVADARYCFALPAALDDFHAAPLLCAGLIGYRALRMAGDARRLGIYGFGAAAHVIAQVALWQGRAVYACTRPGDLAGQAFARSAGLRLGRGLDAAATRTARCRADLRPRWRAGARGAAGNAQGRRRHLCRHPHERHSRVSVSLAVG